jgi:hypothetical protein
VPAAGKIGSLASQQLEIEFERFGRFEAAASAGARVGGVAFLRKPAIYKVSRVPEAIRKNRSKRWNGAAAPKNPHKKGLGAIFSRSKTFRFWNARDNRFWILDLKKAGPKTCLTINH